MTKSSQFARSSGLQQSDIEYFRRGEVENPRFWARLGGKPLLQGANVVDVGCGHGSLCIDLALSGARRVVGLDIDPHRIEFANENLRNNYPHLRETVDFRNLELRQCSEFELDAIVSKDTFEHIIDLQGMLGEMRRRLKPGGRVYAGFGPLYNAPDGDHGRTQIPIPWGHLLASETMLVQRLNRNRETGISSIVDLGLNKMSLQAYKQAFQGSGLSLVLFRVNQGAQLAWPYRTALALFSVISKIPFLEEYFTVNVYCILEKEEDECPIPQQ